MTNDLKPYSIYKYSGVEWLTEVQEHWRVVRAKWLLERMDRPIRSADQVATCFRVGVVTLRRNRRVLGFTESLKEIGNQGVCRPGRFSHVGNLCVQRSPYMSAPRSHHVPAAAHDLRHALTRDRLRRLEVLCSRKKALDNQQSGFR